MSARAVPGEECLILNGREVTAMDLARARQEIARRGVLAPSWDELTDDERAVSVVAAGHELRALELILSGEVPA